MKKILILSAFVFLALAQAIAAKHTITASGMSFTPDAITIMPGDTVIFNLDMSHDAVEVSQATWMANGSVSNGGFSLPFGGGMIVMNNPGTYYYVCTSHANVGMKGMITVQNVTGYSKPGPPDDIDVYPNPAKDFINVSVLGCNQEAGEVEIYSLTGQKYFGLSERMLPEKCVWQIDLGLLPAGMYILSIRQQGNVYSRKFVRQ
jgi:plastocyanin